MKLSTPAGDGLAIPAACTGLARRPTPALDAQVTTLNGTYRWTITEEDALAHGTPADNTPENLATFPWVLTMKVNDGTWTLSVRSEGEDSQQATEEPFTVSGDQITFQWGGGELKFTFSVDGEGNLHLVPVEPMAPGDQFVWATHPWTKIE